MRLNFQQPTNTNLLASWGAKFSIGPVQVAALIAAPLIIAFGYLSLWYLGASGLANEMLNENHVVELLTFVFMFAGSLFGFWLARQTRKHNEATFVTAFYAVFSLGLFVTAMEEIAWGQWFFFFETPESIKSVNMQGETTIHNLESVVSLTEDLRLLFGIGGFVGILASSIRPLKKIGASPLLASWFAIIIAWSLFELFAPEDSRVYHYADRMSEVTEMLIGVSAALYLYLNYRYLSASWMMNAEMSSVRDRLQRRERDHANDEVPHRENEFESKEIVEKT